nr:helix-turn-helix domain-containing protein [Burkholderia glumae]
MREIARRTGLSRNTVRRWLRQTDAVEPKYPKRVSPSVIDDWAAQLTGWLRADSHRPVRACPETRCAAGCGRLMPSSRSIRSVSARASSTTGPHS